MKAKDHPFGLEAWVELVEDGQTLLEHKEEHIAAVPGKAATSKCYLECVDGVVFRIQVNWRKLHANTPLNKRDISAKLYIDGGLVESSIVTHRDVGATFSRIRHKDRDGRTIEQGMSFADFGEEDLDGHVTEGEEETELGTIRLVICQGKATYDRMGTEAASRPGETTGTLKQLKLGSRTEPKGIPKIADQVEFYRIKVAQGTTYELVFKYRNKTKLDILFNPTAATFQLPLSRKQHEARHAQLATESRKRPLQLDSEDEEDGPDFSTLEPRFLEVFQAMERRNKRQKEKIQRLEKERDKDARPEIHDVSD